MGKIEKEIEKYLIGKIKNLGGLCYKWKAWDNKGVPDRVCVLPWMGVFLVEVKDLYGKTSPLQEATFKKIEEHGGAVFIVYGKEGVDKLIEFLTEIKERKDNGTRGI